jgi:hypothetical protein
VLVINESPTEVFYEADPSPQYMAEETQPSVSIPQAPPAEQTSRAPSYPKDREIPQVLESEVVRPLAYPGGSGTGVPPAPSLRQGPYQAYPYASGPGLLRTNTAEPAVSSLVGLELSVGQQAGLRAALFDARWLLEDRFEIPAGAVALWERGAWAVLSRWGVAYRFYQGPRLFARAQIGGRLWFDDVQTAVGCFGGLGLTAYAVKPLVMDIDANVGVVGHARVFEGSAFIGIGWRRAALRVGYRALYVDELSLSSPMVGVGAWW